MRVVAHGRALILSLIAAVVLGACAPVANLLVDLTERSDGATLTYVLRDAPGGPGLAFDPDGRTARRVIVRAEGDELALLAVPDGATCTVTTTSLDCRLGDVTEVTVVNLTGLGVVANATYRRAGSSTVYLTTARLPGEGE